MPLATTPLGYEIPKEPEAPKIYSETYRHSIVDSTYQPEQSLLSMVQGAPRMAQYFRCWLADNEEPKEYSPGSIGTYQSYTKIDRVPLKIEGDASFNFNAETGEGDKTYSAWIGFGRPPIRHDVFVMDIGDGHAGLFAVVEQPEIRNATANKVYQIQFKQLGILTKDLFEELESRVVEELVYSKDSVLHGGHSVITKGEEEVAMQLFQWGVTIGGYIMKTFYWNPERTIVWDHNGEKVYDPYLVEFLAAVIPGDYRGKYPTINQFSVQYGGLETGRWGTTNIWEVLLRCDWNLMHVLDNQAAMIDTGRLMNTRLYGNLRNSKIKYFISTNPDDFLTYKVYFNMDGYPILEPGPQEDISYLFSKEFYQGNPQGEFENIVYSSYRDQQIDHKRLLDYCKTYFTLPKRDQLYHGAILLRLLQFARKLGGPL